MLFQCWASAVGGGPTLKQHCLGKLDMLHYDREVARSDHQGLNFESCVWRAASSRSSHHPQEVLLAQFSLYVHPIHFISLYIIGHFTCRSPGEDHFLFLVQGI